MEKYDIHWIIETLLTGWEALNISLRYDLSSVVMQQQARTQPAKRMVLLRRHALNA
ncbi:hypothetical protein ABIB38_004633 [Massilia sp. UYP11]|uniref:hypothetical protein n=1 Tax=Massilia sp. UYP11 TaxID=1756385 RepID=UPI003D1C2341